MKLVKAFVKSCYSEGLISESSNARENENEDGSLITEDKDGNATEQDISYHGGLGLKYKFPGDSKKLVITRLSTFCLSTFFRLREASKIKLWTTYLKGQSLLAKNRRAPPEP